MSQSHSASSIADKSRLGADHNELAPIQEMGAEKHDDL